MSMILEYGGSAGRVEVEARVRMEGGGAPTYRFFLAIFLCLSLLSPSRSRRFRAHVAMFELQKPQGTVAPP
jgi:hypothetical protein